MPKYGNFGDGIWSKLDRLGNGILMKGVGYMVLDPFFRAPLENQLEKGLVSIWVHASTYHNLAKLLTADVLAALSIRE